MDIIARQINDVKSTLESMREQLDRIDSYYTPEKAYLHEEIQKEEKKLALLESVQERILKGS